MRQRATDSWLPLWWQGEKEKNVVVAECDAGAIIADTQANLVIPETEHVVTVNELKRRPR